MDKIGLDHSIDCLGEQFLEEGLEYYSWFFYLNL